MDQTKMNQKMKHTVTGATGYTGRYITRRLLELGHQVQSITGHPGRENSFGDRVKLNPFNFDRPDRLRETPGGADTLFNTYWIRVNHGGRTSPRARGAGQGDVRRRQGRRREKDSPHQHHQPGPGIGPAPPPGQGTT